MINDRILVDELTPRFGGYERGDVVVFRDPGRLARRRSATPPRPPLIEAVDWVLSFVGLSAPDSDDHLIKRIIGLPGDHVVCCNALGQITVNGVPDRRDAVPEARPRASAARRRSRSTSSCPDGLALGARRQPRSLEGLPLQPGPAAAGASCPVDNVVGRAFLITWPLEPVRLHRLPPRGLRRRAGARHPP